MPQVARARWVTSLVAPVVVVAGACTSSDLLPASGFAGADESMGGSSGGGIGKAERDSFPPPDELGPEALRFPEVACTPSPDDADASADAGMGVADAGADGSPCQTPPPGQCLGPAGMLVLLPGVCSSEGKCLFRQHRMHCLGGCFRQLDGGHRCNEY